MLFIENPSTEPWFNIAAEEYLLKHFDSDIVMIWSSSPSIIVGKHQNTLAEINFDYVKKHRIPVIRRLSGGGTVFHDEGNINFTFIRKADGEKLIDFRMHTQPIIEFLQSLGINAQFGGKNDLRVNGLKISGNAEHIYRQRILHHGTLLFDSDLERLQLAIRGAEQNFESKAVKSNRSQVVNISSLLRDNIDRLSFTMLLREYLIRYFSITDFYSFDNTDKQLINALKSQKYTQWEWNFGYSPTYILRNKKIIGGEEIKIEITVSKGLINKAEILIGGNITTIDALRGVTHSPDDIEEILTSGNFAGINQLKEPWELTSLFF